MQTDELDFINYVYTLQNSLQSSNSLWQRNLLNSELVSRCQYSLNTDVASSHLKLASTLYCSGHLHAAVIVLEDVERRYHSKVKAVCGCRPNEGSDLRVFSYMTTGTSNDGFSESPFACGVSFFKQESCIAPFILLFEMIRSITEEEVAQRDFDEKLWKTCAEVDARPFLHYLQYLTYGGLGQRDEQLHALVV
ncbi:hypothetical protein DPMN_021159 [Dreissena polymorpha]|uniref:Uncharacterized protein n=1 Tax=Dreissena polymorpha TaxID=45954 RepID=A0A9D4NLK7_DREPO|nr:hypothetical protein DPMN_021159 [Dreissena polymorpha]